jgi:hypothetical protein
MHSASNFSKFVCQVVAAKSGNGCPPSKIMGAPRATLQNNQKQLSLQGLWVRCALPHLLKIRPYSSQASAVSRHLWHKSYLHSRLDTSHEAELTPLNWRTSRFFSVAPDLSKHRNTSIVVLHIVLKSLIIVNTSCGVQPADYSHPADYSRIAQSNRPISHRQSRILRCLDRFIVLPLAHRHMICGNK